MRAKNLDLIRWMNYGHKSTAEKLKYAISNENYLSEMATGRRKITDDNARRIETELSLPKGWMDRDNISILKTLTDIDIDIIDGLTQCTNEQKQGLKSFLASK